MLGVIMGALDLVKRRIAKGDFGIQRFLDAATAATERAATLTQRLLAFARQQPLSPQPLDANKMIGNMSELLHSTLGEHIQIETVAAARLVDGLMPISSSSKTPFSTSRSTPATPCRTAASSRSKPPTPISTRPIAEPNPEVDARPIRDDRDHRHRPRHDARGGRARLRSVLHHQGRRQGHRARLEPGLRLRQAVARAHQSL